ncbi:telomere-associated protein RIF1 [Anopheles nili]|uniref:telomere-associated protein RIF1 n=1 Tax=Anopheles nili TaxID=185578 RepID=UPI00237C3D6A|nr:telomere-associated protein RIF1 [Anopheles nili]
MTAFNHLMPGREHREALRNAIQYKMYEDIDHILLEIEKVCQCSTVKVITDKKSTIDQDELKFWLVDVGRLMFDERSTNTRRLALNALDAAASYIVTTNYQEHSKWPELRGILSKEYTCLLDTARSEKDPNWHRVWSVLVRIVNRDLCQGSSIINMFLSIVEAGFRSPELSIREQSFDCWRLLVEIFAKNKQINILKRVKLICIPLKSSKSKTEAIALKKFDIWWFLLCHLRSQLTSMVDTIFEPFIYFCFGPTFKTPLCYYFDESYQEYGAPGKMYQSIKQLSAIALIHLLGTVPDICKTLLNCPNNTDSKLPFSFETFSSENGLCISSLLFSMKSKLIIDSCIECTVLFAEMKHLDYLSLNRCLWNNLIDRIIEEKTIPKHEMLQWIKEDMDSLLKLCIRQKHDLPLRELLYDTILKIAESDLIVINIGHDSPDQLTFNYKMIMSLIIHPQLSCPASKTDQIIKRVFDLKRYIKNNNYWDMLKKTIQYMCYSNDENETNGYKFQTLNTQIYCLLGEQLIERIRVDVSSSEENQQTVINFLLYPLEYDHFLVIDTVKNMWINAYESILNNDKASCKFSNTFCEAIKAMTVAKYAYNLEVVADFFCIIFKTIPEKFDHSCPPIKILELFKDLTRKGFAYQSNFDRIQIMVCSFRKLLKKMNLTNVLTLILPIRNVINELISNVHGLAMTEVKETLHVLTKKITLNLSKELTEQPNEVKFNCKMLLTSLLDLPMSVKQEFKINDIKRCINICDYNSINKKTPTRNADKEDFVVINSVWKFKPESLTEHQREKMMEKRTDIPALYNDMSQSQDSFIIKPWAPNKNAILQKDLTNTSDKITPGTHVTASDIEKNSSDHIKLDQLRIDTVEGKSFNVMNLSDARTTRLKSGSKRIIESEKKRTGLSTIDLAAVTNKMVSPLSKKYLEDKMLIKCLLSPSKSPKKNEMGSSSQRTNVGVINEQRDCMSPKRNTSKGVHSSMFENQTGLTSPKVVRFSPVVVVEPITKLELFADTGINPNSHPVSSAMVSKENDEAHIRKNDEVFQLAANDLPESDIDQLSPAKNLDEQMKPLNKSPNRSIVSSPDRADVEERNADLLNNTLNISPISEEKNCSRTYTDDNGVPSSTDKKSSLRKITKEKESTDSPVQMSTNHRRTKASPNLETSDRSNTGSMKSRPLQQSPALAKTRSPSTTMIGLGGRGAQLINLIRNQHGDQSYRPNTPPQNASTPKGSILSEATSISMRKKAIAASVGSIEVNEISETTNENEEKYENVPPQYLVFSKVLPSPQASPASSILKRRHNLDDSVDDIETPVHKRKRVSFHDPPVSLTKEYIRQVEECRTSSVSRNIQLSSNIASSTDKTKFMMRRRSKSDSISELQNFTQKQTTTEINKTANLSCLQDVGRSGNKNDERSISPESLDESNFMMNDRTDNMSTLQVTTECMETEADKSESYKAKSVASKTNIQADSEDTFEQNTKDTEKVHGSFKELSFTCEEAVFEYVMKNYTLDDIVERYISAGKSLEKNKTVRVLTKELSSKMSDDPKMREIVLDELSERHSVEFLDHAIQENSNAKVCERLSLTVMIDHIFKQLHTSHGTHTNKGLVATLDEKEEDATKIVEYIYEKLFNLRNIELDGQTFDELRDRFVRHELANKTRLEIMSLLEEYFKTSNEEQC